MNPSTAKCLLGLTSERTEGAGVATFVLIHGAWHGGWSWQKVTPYLRSAGHDVLTPTLTGLGERSHLLSPDVSLSTHIEDVVNLLFYEDLHDAILVGHSYGGMLLEAAAAAMPDRVTHLVYLDALVPDEGQSVFDVLPEAREEWTMNAIEIHGARVYPFPREYLAGWGITDPAEVAWLEARLTPHPLATEEEPLELPGPRVEHVTSCYIRCCGEPGNPVPMSRQATKAKNLGMEYFEVATGHNALFTAPRETAARLNEIASHGVRV